MRVAASQRLPFHSVKHCLPPRPQDTVFCCPSSMQRSFTLLAARGGLIRRDAPQFPSWLFRTPHNQESLESIISYLRELCVQRNIRGVGIQKRSGVSCQSRTAEDFNRRRTHHVYGSYKINSARHYRYFESHEVISWTAESALRNPLCHMATRFPVSVSNFSCSINSATVSSPFRWASVIRNFVFSVCVN